MNLKHNLKSACTFIAMIMGAGFASGQEIALYFASTNIFVPLFSAFIFGIMCFIFAEAGRVTDGKFLELWFKKFTLPAKILIMAANAVILCAMLAGSELVIKDLLGISGGSFYSAGLVLIAVYAGEEKIKLLNIVAIPIIIALILIILFKSNPKFPSFKEIRLFSPFIYSAMNILSAGFLMSSMSKRTKFSDSIVSSAITTVILGALIGLIYSVIQNSFDKTMPVLYAAKAAGVGQAAAIMLYLCIFTTMTGSLLVASDKKFRQACIITAITLILSFFGFKEIIRICYPIIGYLGILLCVYTLIRLIGYCCSRKKSSSMKELNKKGYIARLL